MSDTPLKVAVSGAAGQICYSLLFRLAHGDLFGPDRPVILHLLDLEQALPAVRGVVMELEDCAFPLLKQVIVTADPETAFGDIDAALLVGSRPRSKGMERRDLLAANAAIFKTQGAALNAAANRDARVIVVGNPANTNAWILAEHARDFPRDNISSMIRLDHNRAQGQLAAQAGVGVEEIEKLVVWGNHSPTMFADWTYATIDGAPLKQRIGDADWYTDTLIPRVAQRSSRRAAPRRRRRRPMRRSTTCATGGTAATAAGCRWACRRPATTAFPKDCSAACRSPAAPARSTASPGSISTNSSG